MPNHVHVLIKPLIELRRIVQSWKSYTGRWALAHHAELGLRAPGGAKNRFWMPDYWDRYIRDENHYRNTIRYIHHNPVKANLCADSKEWPWSSARPFYPGTVNQFKEEESWRKAKPPYPKTAERMSRKG